MKPKLILFLLVLSALVALAGGPSHAADCPAGHPSSDGAEILPGSPCILRDAAGNAWGFADAAKPNATVTLNGKRIGVASALAINRGGKAFIETRSCQYRLWYIYAPDRITSAAHQEIAPSAPPVAPPYTLLRAGKAGRYFSLKSAATELRAGDVLQIAQPPRGIPIWQGAGGVTVPDVTIDGGGAK
ncbi:MAG: hypothetical protein ACREFQ_21265, partial [Stellaceae bacterium]